ncbi:hypothetical protein MVEN_01818000 [Mycena venus]|uniref:Rhodopsin domain-containing protein n=1 Tax=Mycena venus TaxID=2733690 RepID=A0A8H7CP13_9AGAR|nr:hypothetical protein MVEN_01818000 [Mycena venus]
MINPSGPLVQLKITSITCSFFALGSTLYRLYQRRGRFGGDDLWAVFASVALIVQVIIIFLHIPPPNNLPKKGGVAVYYLTGIAFYAIVWGSRLSILFSIIRIDPTFERRRRLFWVAVVFIVISLALLAQLFSVCESKDPSWKNAPNPQCPLPLQVAVCQLVTDIIADSILLFSPWPLFRDLLGKGMRHKLTIIFSTCVVTTIVSLVHAAYILRNGGMKVVISAVVEDCISLIVANIPVVVTSVVDIAGDTEEPRNSRTRRFSTVFWLEESVATGRGVLTEGAVVTLTLPTHVGGDENPASMELQATKEGRRRNFLESE